MKMLPVPTKERKTLGYYIGCIFGYLLIGCLAAIMIAITIRVCSWILPM